MDARPKLLDELAVRHVTPVLTAAGFRKTGKRRWHAGEAPGNLVLVQMRPHHVDPEEVGFWIEWSVIPAAMCDFQNRDSPKPMRPQITWGIVSDRVDVPVEMAVPANIVGFPSWWSFSVAAGVDECGAALRRLLTEGGLADWWLAMLDRERLLRVLDEGKINSRFKLPVATPRAWPWRHLAMYIDDGDPEVLDGMLVPLEEAFPAPDLAVPWRNRHHELSVWLRQRLDGRLAEHRA